MSDIPAGVRRVVELRSMGVCEGCGRRRATDMHHRRYKTRGGKHEASNLIHLCGGASGLAGGNHSGCHGIAHTAEGERRGWSVESGIRDPYDYPLVLARYGRVRLNNDGGYKSAEDYGSEWAEYTEEGAER